MDLPISEECRQYCGEYGIKPEEFALYGGEDYVLMGTVPEHAYYKLRDLMKSGGCSIFPIGRTKADGGIRIQNQVGEMINVGTAGFDHFKSGQE
jgi:thiamine-monophosphate kinase